MGPTSVRTDLYAVLGVPATASAAQIKASYRRLVKQHHPDAGGDGARARVLNAAWEVLGDQERRHDYDHQRRAAFALAQPDAPASTAARTRPGAVSSRQRGAVRDGELLVWLQQVYGPIDRLLGQVINPFPSQLRELAADPYDDALMEGFCTFLQESRARLERVESIYRSRACPAAARGFGLSLYHCLGQVQDALVELERYTMGYVDSYLHDGREMIREAKKRRSLLQQERRRLDL